LFEDGIARLELPGTDSFVTKLDPVF